MKTLKRFSLRQLDKAELSKRQEGLLFGGGNPGDCRCGSCASEDGTPAPSTAANSSANAYYGYTISGSNPAECTCSLNLSTDNMSIKPGW